MSEFFDRATPQSDRRGKRGFPAMGHPPQPLPIVPTKLAHYDNRGHMQGTIKKVVHDRGFGFIQAQDGKEIFFHRSSLQQLDFDTLKEGESVEFEVERGDKGPRAINVRTSRA